MRDPISPGRPCLGCGQPITGDFEMLVDALEEEPIAGHRAWRAKPDSVRFYHPACLAAAGDAPKSFYRDGRIEVD